MDYVFYFDESFHDRKISIKEDGIINTLEDNTIDNYIGVFWGCEQKNLRENIEKLKQFENKYRAIFTIPDDKEFKSNVIAPKNYTYGVHSFNKITTALYIDFFSMLDEIKPIIQIDAISKMEWALRVIFKPEICNWRINWNSFFYSLTKFFVTYKPVDIIQSMYKVQNTDTLCQFQKHLVQGLKRLASTEQGIARKEREAKSFLMISEIIENMELQDLFDKKIDFTYIPNFEGFCRLLQEKKIDPKRIKLVIDREQRTYKTAQNYPFKKITQGDSMNVIQIRFSDFISGFVGRMIRGLMHDPAVAEKQITDIDNLDRDALIEKRLLNPDWFDLDEHKFNLYQLIYKVMIINCESYWATMTLSYCDEVCCFYSLIRYIASYENYIEFSKILPEMHTEYYNSCCIDELEEHYSKM